MIYRGNRTLALDHLALARRLARQGNARLARECRARARELDPSLSPRMTTDSAMALDAATENAVIERAIRTARKSTRTTSRKPMTRSSSGFNSDALFQRDPDSRDRGPDFARTYAARNSPRRVHALDAAPDHEAALKQLEHARNHVESVQAGSSDFDRERFVGYLQAALAAMGSEDAEDEGKEEQEYDSGGLPVPTDRAKAKDGVGETEARSVVTSSAARRDVDHRNDFNSAKQGADSADFDAASLFQKG